jgi:hypothetical protein
MIAAVDRDRPDAETLVELIDDIEPSTDHSIPSIPGIRTLAAEDDPNDETVDRVIEEVVDLLGHDRSPIHRLATTAAVILIEREPTAADRLVERLIGTLETEASQCRGLEALEEVATVAPAAVGDRLGPVVDRLDHPRDGVSRHAAGTVLAVAQDAPERLVDELPALLSMLAAAAEPDDPETGRDVGTLQRRSRIERAASRLLVARAVAEVARQRPDAAAETVLESGADDHLRSLFEDEQPRIRAAAAGLAAHAAEREPDAFEPAVSTLVDLLSDDHEVVRASAVWTLGALDDPDTVEALERTSREDPSEEIRALAGETVAGTETDFNHEIN